MGRRRRGRRVFGGVGGGIVGESWELKRREMREGRRDRRAGCWADVEEFRRALFSFRLVPRWESERDRP